MKDLAPLYEQMLTIRLLEDRLQAKCDAGEAGDLHFNKGQEAITVGVCAMLRPQDHIVTHHRTIAHQVAKGAPLYPLVAELLGKRTGTNGGKAGEMHINDKNIRHDFSFQLVGTCIPVAAGLAWALKHHHKKDEIVAVFFGDAASSNGQFHEGLSIAAIHKLPILFVCENNHLAGNIRPNYYMPTSNVSKRAEGYGISTFSANGNDIEDVLYGVESAISQLHEGPAFLECDTTRLCWHKQGQRDVRSTIERAELARRDPLLFVERKLGDDLDKEVILTRVKAALDDAFSRAEADLPPEAP